MTGQSGRVRMRDRTGNDDAFGHAPPVVLWRCAQCKQQSRMLRVYLTRTGWLVMREQLKVPLADWLEHTGTDMTVEDVRGGLAATMGEKRINLDDRELPLDIDTWPSGDRFQIGCRRCGSGWAGIGWLAEDCCRARDTRTQIVRQVGKL